MIKNKYLKYFKLTIAKQYYTAYNIVIMKNKERCGYVLH